MLYKDQPPSDVPPPAPKPPVANAEELARQLRAAVRRNRPWSKGRKVTTLVLLLLMAALLTWWFWPRPLPAHVYVIAFDQLTVPDQQTTLYIATEPADPKAESWGGQEVFVQELKPQGTAAEMANTVSVRTDNKGLATALLPFAATPSFALVEVRYLDTRSRPPWHDKSQGRVFAWPAKTPLLVVELTEQAKSEAGLAAALEQAQGMGWKVVYLATGAERPLGYQEWRDWALQQMAEDAQPKKLPTGPVLGRRAYFDGADAQQAREAILAALKKQFQGDVVRPEVANGTLTVHVVGRPQIAVQPGSWQNLEQALKQLSP